MRRQRGVDGVTLINVRPRFLVTPAELETVAQKTLAEITPAATDDANVFSNALTLIVDPRLDDVSEDRWYLCSDPGLAPVLQYAYLDGADGPQIESRNGFDVDGVEVRCRLDFGAGAVDYRGAHAADGTS